MVINYELIFGIVGTTTGISSLFWHIWDNKSKLKIAYNILELKKDEDFDGINNYLYLHTLLKNKGHKSTSIECVALYFDINIPIFEVSKKTKLPIKIEPNSSQILDLYFGINKEEYNAILNGKQYSINFYHTFGRTWKWYRKYNIKVN